MNASFNDWKRSFKEIGIGLAALGGAISAFGISAFKTYAETAQLIELMSLKTGMSIQAVSEFNYILTVTGGSLVNLQTGFRTIWSYYWGYTR